MWSDEELRDIEPETPIRRTGARILAGSLRQTLSQRNLSRAASRPHELTRGETPSIIYAPHAASHGNFIEASYRRIAANPQWRKRLQKAHSSKRQARRSGPDEEIRSWRELDSATSSDALLMNIFCYPRLLAGTKLPALLGVDQGQIPEFGYHPRILLERSLTDRTEIDMRLGSLLVEAKLTEADFQTAPMRLLDRYPDFNIVFDRDALEVTGAGVRSYQLIRGILAAHAEGATFCLMCDGRRPDLIEAWYGILLAVRSYELRTRLRLLTWQEIAGALPLSLRTFLAEKYGIEATRGD